MRLRRFGWAASGPHRTSRRSRNSRRGAYVRVVARSGTERQAFKEATWYSTLAGGVLLATLAASPADVTGKWSGTLTAQESDGTKREDGALLILSQKDTTITGTIGGSESDQHTITSGKIDENKRVIKAATS